MTDKSYKPVVLVVMDGVGEAPPSETNAVSVAATPHLDRLRSEYPATQIEASGRAVGLPVGQMGNSEVGHLNLGAGRIVMQDLVRIDAAIEDRSFFENKTFLDAIANIRAAGGRAHLIGLTSPGGVHSALSHLYGLVDLLHDNELDVFLHALTDGRDTPPSSARGYLQDVEERIAGKARVATITGRFYSMDRDQRWDRVERGYRGHVLGEGTAHATVDEAIAAAYAAGETDEFITPRVICDEGGAPIGKIEDGDGVIFFNFRGDRAREITEALALDGFDGFERPVVRRLSSYVCMAEYQADYGLPVAFAPQSMSNILDQIIAGAGKTQFHCAETEKYAHVTFFFNGGQEEPFAGEERRLIPSPKEVATYDLKPQMSAPEVTEAMLEALDSERFDFLLVNYANGDMVGHTGVIPAAVHAVETVDTQVGRLVEKITELGGAVLITADHGNSEKMVDETTGQPHTAHTTNPVPCILVSNDHRNAVLRDGGSLRDVAPTLLELLGLESPAEMSGGSLIAHS